MHFTSLHDLLVFELEDLLAAERLLVESLPKMAAAASDEKLRQAFEKHLEETRENHVARLQEAFSMLDQQPQSRTCKGMEGIVQEGEEMVKAGGDPATRDAALIGAGQRAEHYEIAAYGTARTHAEELGLNEIADLLQETLDNEAKTNESLTKLAEGGLLAQGINPKAEA